MTIEPGGFRVATERIHLPPMTFDNTFHWDGLGSMSRSGDGLLGLSAVSTGPPRHRCCHCHREDPDA